MIIAKINICDVFDKEYSDKDYPIETFHVKNQLKRD